MLGFCYSKKLVPAAWAITDSAATQLHRLLLVQCRRLFSSASSSLQAEKPKNQGQSFTVSYLVDKCGLSREKALSVSQKMTLRTPTNPDSVLNLLRNHGLTKTHISGVIRCNPKLLLTNPQKTLLPKLQILASIDVSNDELGRILIRNPSLLTRNLRDVVARHLDFLRAEVLLSRAQIVKVLKNSQRFLSRSLEDSIASNIALLRELGMPQSSVSALVTCNPDTVYMHFRMFHGFVRETIANGYNPKESKFLHALVLFSALSKSTRERKMESYRRWGWSEEQIQVTLQAHPQFMYVSEKKFKLVMEFLVNKAGWQTADCVRCPSIFNHSLEKRIVPRCSVIVILLSKGLVKKNTPLGTILCSGILVQLPLPKHINEEVLGEISVEKDVDGFHPLKGRDPLFLPCTPKGCLELLSRSGVTVKGKKAVVGRSNIVGLPVALLFLKADATVTVVHSRTQDPESIIREADNVIAAAGQESSGNDDERVGDWIKPGAAVIDVGTNPVDDPTKKSGYKLVGDVDFQEAKWLDG